MDSQWNSDWFPFFYFQDWTSESWENLISVRQQSDDGRYWWWSLLIMVAPTLFINDTGNDVHLLYRATLIFWWSLTIAVALLLYKDNDFITISSLLLHSDISPPFRHCIITWWSLTLISYECITISSLLLHSDISPPFWHLVKPLKNSQFWRPKKWMWGLQKKVIPRIHIGMAFLQKTGSKLVKFGPCGPTYILPGHIGGRHPVPCLSTQIAERQGTAMY